MAEPDIRARILIEATRLFGSKGYGSTTVRELVEAAGVTKPTLYYYFGSKEGLYLQTVDTHMAYLEQVMQECLEQAGTLREKLVAVAHRLVTEASANADVVRFLMTAQHNPERGLPQVDLMSLHEQRMRRLGELMFKAVADGELRDDLDTSTLLLSFIGIVNLFSLSGFHGHTHKPDFANEIVELFLHGAATR